MQRRIVFVYVILVGYMVAAAALAQRTTAPAPPQNARFGNPNSYARNFQDYLYGVVAKLHQDELVLDKTRFGVLKTVKLTKKTKFIRSGKRSSLAQLKPGDMVYVQVKKDKKSGALTAKKVVSGMGVTGGV